VALLRAWRARGASGWRNVGDESALDRVQELADLRNRVILTDDEFQVAKERLLGEVLGQRPPEAAFPR